MDRRKFLSAASAASATAAAAAAAAFPAPAIAQGTMRLKMVTTWPKNSAGLFNSAQRIADRIALATNDQIQIKVFAAGELVPAFESFDVVSAGSADMYHGVEYYWQGKSRAFNFFSGVPFGLTGVEHLAWIYYGGGQEVWDELSANFNVKGFVLASTGVQMGGWFNKEINRLDDVKGLKIRMPGIGGEVMRRLGAAVVGLPGGEVYPALASGVIDATEWIGPWSDLQMGFYEVAKYYYWPGWHEPGSVFAAGINKGLWDSLTPEQQAVFNLVTQAEANIQMCEFQARNADALANLVNDHGTELRQYPDDLLLEIAKHSRDVVAELGQADEMSQKAYASFEAFRKDAIGWAGIGELAFLKARAAAFGRT